MWNLVLDGGPDYSREGALLTVIWLPIVTYLRMSAFCIVHVPPWANVPVQRMQHTNAFVAMRIDKTAMRLFAKLLWTLVFILISCSITDRPSIVINAIACFVVICKHLILVLNFILDCEIKPPILKM